MAVARLVGGTLVRGLLTAHLAGILLLCLVVSVEAVDQPLDALVQTLRARVPELWAAVAAVLGMAGVGVTVAGARRRGALLGLGTLGVHPAVFLLGAALCAGSFGLVSGRVSVPPADVPGAWERGEGGWIRGGEAWPDAPDVQVRARPPKARSTAADVVNAAAAGVCGAALGLWTGPFAGLLVVGSLLVVDVVAQGLTARAVLPEVFVVSSGALSLILALGLRLRAPLFPRRWG